MEEDHHQRYIKWGIVAVTALFSIFLLYLNILTPYLLGDDLLFQLKLPEDGIMGSEPIKSLSDLIESQVNFYKNYHYRIFNHTILQILLLLPSLVFDVLNVVVFLLIPLPILQVKKDHTAQNWWVCYLTILMFIWIFHLCLGWAYFSTTGSLNYTWMLLPQLWYVASLIDYLEGHDNGKMLLRLALINSLGNENASVMLFVITIVVLFWSNRENKKMLWWNIVILAAGGLFMLLSPSVGKRLATQDFMVGGLLAHLMEFSKRTIYYCILYCPVLLILLFSAAKNSLRSLRHIILGIAFLSATFSMVLAPLFESRSAVLGFFILMMMMVSMTKGPWHKWPLYILTVVGILLCFLRLPDFHDLSARHQTNHLLLEKNRGNDGIVYLSRYCDNTSRNFLLCHEISGDPDAFDNKSAAAYYNINQVALSKTYSQEYRGEEVLSHLSNNPSLLSSYDSMVLTDKMTIYQKKNEKGSDILVRNSGEKSYFILRGSLRKSLKHRAFNALPSSIRLSLLDYLEDVLTNKQPMRTIQSVHYNYLFIPDSERYDYFLLSSYDLTSHTPIGETHVIKSNQEY